jgi:ATP-binding cassette subfamily B protein
VTIGTLVLFLSYVEKLFKPLRELAQKYDVLQRAMASAERIFDVLDRDTESYDGASVPALSEGRTGRRIEFDGVWFRYGSGDGDDEWILRDVSFTVEPGEQVGLVGPTGAGKTTIFKLLLRWYDVQRGEIRVDGTDIRSMDLAELRSQFGVVLQDGFLFSGSVMQNMKTMAKQPSDDTVRRTARELGVDSYVESLPDEYRTLVSSGGPQMSEGERQYIALTRALVSDPAVLLFDEATADMDSGLEKKLLEGLDEFGFDRTAITIAHRLSTIRDCDRIFVLDRGEIVERGDHRTLLANDGLYASLYELQVKTDEPF